MYPVERWDTLEHLYVDESGSMSHEQANAFPYFLICTIRVKDSKKLKRRYKRFVAKYIDELKNLDNGKMFNGEHFKELKGSSFNFEMKEKFVDYFCRNDLFEIYYIQTINNRVKPNLYKNTARAFNFLYKLKLRYFLKTKHLPNDEYIIQFDNRNQKNESKNSLEDYLNAELHLNEELTEEIHVQYFNSENNSFIQIADVFSNICYSYCFQPEKYNPIIKKLFENEIIKGVFKFPIY